MKKTKKPYKRIALSLSMCLIMIWVMLGTSASLAWYQDTSKNVRNVFLFGSFELEVSYKKDGAYQKLETDTAILNEEDLYEPGFVKVQYLKVENKGDVDFDFHLSLNEFRSTPGVNAHGDEFNLRDYIRYGVVYADTEDQLDSLLANRELAAEKAVEPLNEFTSDTMTLPKQTAKYMALILRMPEEVGNEANYRNVAPKIEFRIVVTATQQHQ